MAIALKRSTLIARNKKGRPFIAGTPYFLYNRCRAFGQRRLLPSPVNGVKVSPPSFRSFTTSVQTDYTTRDRQKEMLMSRGTIYVLDTSVLMHDPEIVDNLKDNEIVIPGPVLQELSDLSHNIDERKKFQAREANNMIEVYRVKGAGALAREGVKNRHGGTVRTEVQSLDPKKKKLPIGLNWNQADNQIILVGLFIKSKEEGGHRPSERRRVVLISKDTNLRARAEACGLESEDYKNDKVENYLSALYGGVSTLSVATTDPTWLSKLYQDGSIDLGSCSNELNAAAVEKLNDNQCVFFELASGKKGQAIFKKGESRFKVVRPVRMYQESKETIIPRNEMQAFALALLDDLDIGILTLVGIAGAGKTLLALNWAYNQIMGQNANGFQRIIVFRSNVEAGKKLGFLPGDLGDKFGPWKEPVYTSMELITKGRVKEKGDGRHQEKRGENFILEQMEENLQLVVMPPNFTRGATYHNAIIIIDDAQNLPMKLLQLLVTRAGEHSRVIITGDPTQIDDPFLDAASCGLIQAAIRFRNNPLCGSIFLPKSERSKIAEVAAMLLN